MLQRARWTHPELVFGSFALAAWIAVASRDHVHRVHAGYEGAPPFVLMTAAMMLPSLLPVLRYVSFSSLASRRQRAAVEHAAGYFAVWTAFAVVSTFALADVSKVHAFDPEKAAVFFLLFAAAWELTRFKRRALRLCHQIAVGPPRGLRADLACIRGGVEHGGHCLASCWALMLVMVAAPASLALLVLLTALVSTQKLLVRGSRLAIQSCVVLLLCAVALVAA